MKVSELKWYEELSGERIILQTTYGRTFRLAFVLSYTILVYAVQLMISLHKSYRGVGNCIFVGKVHNGGFGLYPLIWLRLLRTYKVQQNIIQLDDHISSTCPASKDLRYQ